MKCFANQPAYCLVYFVVLTTLTPATTTMMIQQRQVSGALQQINLTRGEKVVMEFRSSMLVGISKFPAHRQCSILTTILEESGEDITHVANKLLLKIHHDLPCLRHGTINHEQGTINMSAVQQATDIHVTKLFNRLPQPFRCVILTKVTSKINNIKPQLVEATSLHKTTAHLSKRLLLFGNTAKCISPQQIIRPSQTTTNGPNPTITTGKLFVRIGVRLKKSMTLKAWIKRFKNKLPIIYGRYAVKKGKISRFVKTWKKGEDISQLPQDLFVVNIQGIPLTSNNVVLLTFSLMARENGGEYRRVPGKEVSAAINALSRSQVNTMLQCEVIGSLGVTGDLKPTYNPEKKFGKLSDGYVARLQQLFPRYLLKYFKTSSAFYQCYILKQLSVELNQHLFLVEKSYHAIGMLAKKYFCSRASHTQLSQRNNTVVDEKRTIWREIDQLCRIRTWKDGEQSNKDDDENIIGKTRPFNVMELVLFALLGFLCVLILAFVANCVIFTFKTKRLTSKYNDKTLNTTTGEQECQQEETQYVNKHITSCGEGRSNHLSGQSAGDNGSYHTTTRYGGSLSVVFSERDYDTICALDHEVEQINEEERNQEEHSLFH